LKIADFGLSTVVFAAETTSGDIQNFPKDYRSSQTSFSNVSSPVTPQRASEMTPESLRRLRSVVGSPHYIAPEIAHGGNDSFCDI
jgi:serine/threonine protein kinase